MADSSVEFRRAPVHEVAIGVQFAPVSFTGPALAPFWEGLRDRFPTVEEQPPLSPISEDFGPPRPPQFSLELVGAPLAPRYWFLSEDKSRLLQIQRDRFVFNWRRQKGEEYPRFTALREEFDTFYRGFSSFCDEKIGVTLEPNWGEVVYVNLIALEAGEGAPSAVALLAEATLPSLPQPDDTTATWRFTMHDEGEEAPVGRLVATVQQGFDPATFAPLLNLTLTARGIVTGQPRPEDMTFLDSAHTWLLRGFSEITTKSIQEQWERVE